MRAIGQPDPTPLLNKNKTKSSSVPAVNLSPWAQLKSEHKGKVSSFLLSSIPPATHPPPPHPFSAPGSHPPLPVPRSPRILAARVGDRSETLKPYKAYPCPTHRGQWVQLGLACCGLDKLTPHFSSALHFFSKNSTPSFRARRAAVSPAVCGVSCPKCHRAFIRCWEPCTGAKGARVRKL